MALRLAVDLKLFDAIAAKAAESTDGSFDIHELAEKTHADPLLTGKSNKWIQYQARIYDLSSHHEIFSFHVRSEGIKTRCLYSDNTSSCLCIKLTFFSCIDPRVGPPHLLICWSLFFDVESTARISCRSCLDFPSTSMPRAGKVLLTPAMGHSNLPRAPTPTFLTF